MQLLNLDNYRFILISLSTIIVLFNTCDFATCIDASTKIKEFGYPLETHEVWTDDRAHLGLERIPHNGNTVIGKPVLLIHGLFLNSYIFTANKSSLSFVLSDAGFDVWLYNCRGVGLSRKLSIYKRPGSLPNMKRISWNFSFHEMGVYDLTAVIDFILKKTKHSKLNVVGYSLGATIAFVCLSDKPEYNAKINKLVLISPTTDFKTSPVSTFVKRFPNIVSIMLNGFDFIPYTMDPDSMSSQLRNICAKESILKSCKKVIEFVEGADLQINNNTVLDMVSVLPQPMSSKLLKHFFQMIMKGRLSHYDYGTTGNLLLYNKISSPDYDLSKVTTPTFMIHSTNDHLTPPTDVKRLIHLLPNIKEVYYIDQLQWGHLSFILNPNKREIVNLYIANKLLD